MFMKGVSARDFGSYRSDMQEKGEEVMNKQAMQS